MAGTCKCGNGSLGSIKCGEFLDWLRTCSMESVMILWGQGVNSSVLIQQNCSLIANKMNTEIFDEH